MNTSPAPQIVPVVSLQCGKVKAFREPDETSAIHKIGVTGPVAVTRLGLAGDQQADPVHHGGVDKAIHHYPLDHYAFWREAIGDHQLLEQGGAFGENVSTTGLTEEGVCIGDRWRLGTALVEVSHGRQPCWKLDHHFGTGAPVNAICVKNRNPGWYYRVIEEGEVAAGDTMELVERPWPQWTVSRVFGLLVAGDHKKDRVSLEALGEVDQLADAWRVRREQLLG